MNRETIIEDRVCVALLLAVFVSLFLLNVDLAKVDASFAPPPPACDYHCR
jgi:hypothetical protein